LDSRIPSAQLNERETTKGIRLSFPPEEQLYQLAWASIVQRRRMKLLHRQTEHPWVAIACGSFFSHKKHYYHSASLFPVESDTKHN
jgi:hypothetical protein